MKNVLGVKRGKKVDSPNKPECVVVGPFRANWTDPAEKPGRKLAVKIVWPCSARPSFPQTPDDEETFALSRTTSDAFLSSRNPRKTGWRKRSSLVHSVNLTSQTIDGLTQTQLFISAAVKPGSRPRPVAGSFAQFLSIESPALTSVTDLGEFKFKAIEAFRGILHREVRTALRIDPTILPTWAADRVRAAWCIRPD